MQSRDDKGVVLSEQEGKTNKLQYTEQNYKKNSGKRKKKKKISQKLNTTTEKLGKCSSNRFTD